MTKQIHPPSKHIEWPPPSLLQNPKAIIEYCQDWELSGQETTAELGIIHMGALLATQQWHPARYLFRRNYESKILEGWYAVAAAALMNDVRGAWLSIQAIAEAPESLKAFASVYKEEIAKSFRIYYLKSWKGKGSLPPQHVMEALGFSGPEECQAFLKESVPTPPSTASDGMVTLLSLLEAKEVQAPEGETKKDVPPNKPTTRSDAGIEPPVPMPIDAGL